MKTEENMGHARWIERVQVEYALFKNLCKNGSTGQKVEGRLL